jgi:hypothetical protein
MHHLKYVEYTKTTCPKPLFYSIFRHPLQFTVYNFNSVARALKKLLSADVEVTSTLPNSDTQKDVLM